MKTFKYTFPPNTYRLSANETEHTELARSVVPGLLVTGNHGSYRVTHETSGLAASDYIDKLRDAVDAANRLGALMSWDRPQEYISAEIAERGEDFRKQVRAAGRVQ